MASEEQKKVFAKNLNFYLDSRGLNRAELSRRLDIPETTITNWANGINYPRIDKIQLLSDFFGIMKSDLQEEKSNQVLSMDKLVPIVGKVAAGTPNYAMEDIIGYMTVPPNKPVTKTMMYLEVSSDSMDRQFPIGSFVLVETSNHIENGDIAVVKVNGHDATLKQVKFDYEANRMHLIPDSNNPDYLPDIVDMNVDEVVLVGKVIGHYQSI